MSAKPRICFAFECQLSQRVILRPISSLKLPQRMTIQSMHARGPEISISYDGDREDELRDRGAGFAGVEAVSAEHAEEEREQESDEPRLAVGIKAVDAECVPARLRIVHTII